MAMLFCSSCSLSFNICDFTRVNSCHHCSKVILSSSNNTENSMLLPLKTEIAFRSSKVFCENCSCCVYRSQFPTGFDRIRFPEAGSAEERDLLLSCSLRQIERNQFLERQLSLSYNKQLKLDNELQEMKTSMLDQQRTHKNLETQFDKLLCQTMNDQNTVNESNAQNSKEVAKLREARDEFLLENATLRDELERLKDKCSMLKRREQEVEMVIQNFARELNNGNYDVDKGKYSIKQLNKVEIAVVPESLGQRMVEKRRSSLQGSSGIEMEPYSQMERAMEQLILQDDEPYPEIC